ncbi:MAG: glycoside hydrolase family 66 protein, partial [Puniceicoccales bacterium]
VDICFFHRGASDQRVILKLYPADMEESRTTWPTWSLARVLGATMTGGGSLMVAGEPDESTGTMHALNSLYYPDHQPMSDDNADVLLRYYKHDALLYEYTHGGSVQNLDLRVPLDGGITRSFHAPDRNAICVQLLNLSNQPKWTEPVASVSARKNVTVNISLPSDVNPLSVYYASPDTAAYHLPTELDFTTGQNGEISVLVPELVVHGTLIINYE